MDLATCRYLAAVLRTHLQDHSLLTIDLFCGYELYIKELHQAQMVNISTRQMINMISGLKQARLRYLSDTTRIELQLGVNLEE